MIQIRDLFQNKKTILEGHLSNQPTNLWCPGHWKLHHCSKRSPDFSQNCPVYETYQSSQSFPKKPTKKLGGAKNHMVKITIFTSAPLAVFISYFSCRLWSSFIQALTPWKLDSPQKFSQVFRWKISLVSLSWTNPSEKYVNLKLGGWKFLPQLFGGEELTTTKYLELATTYRKSWEILTNKNSPFLKNDTTKKQPRGRGRGTKSRRDIVLPQRCWDVNFYAQHDGIQHNEDLFVAWPKLEGWITVEASEIRGKKIVEVGSLARFLQLFFTSQVFFWPDFWTINSSM